MPDNPQEFYTVKELAGLLEVTQQTIFRLMQRGALSYYKIGRATRFRRQDVEAYLRTCRVTRRRVDLNGEAC